MFLATKSLKPPTEQAWYVLWQTKMQNQVLHIAYNHKFDPSTTFHFLVYEKLTTLKDSKLIYYIENHF